VVALDFHCYYGDIASGTGFRLTPSLRCQSRAHGGLNPFNPQWIPCFDVLPTEGFVSAKIRRTVEIGFHRRLQTPRRLKLDKRNQKEQ
jgi:hypothetical protein